MVGLLVLTSDAMLADEGVRGRHADSDVVTREAKHDGTGCIINCVVDEKRSYLE